MARSKAPRKAPTQERSRVTVDAIVTATDALLAKGDPKAVTVSAIGERAGVSMGTLYQYFGGLEAILACWEERELETDASAFSTFLVDLANEHHPIDEAIARAIPQIMASVMGRIQRSRVAIAVLGDGDLASRFAERVRLLRTAGAAAAAALEAAPARKQLWVEDLETAVYVVLTSVVYVAYDLAVTEASAEVVARAERALVAMAVRFLVRQEQEGSAG